MRNNNTGNDIFRVILHLNFFIQKGIFYVFFRILPSKTD